MNPSPVSIAIFCFMLVSVAHGAIKAPTESPTFKETTGSILTSANIITLLGVVSSILFFGAITKTFGDFSDTDTLILFASAFASDAIDCLHVRTKQAFSKLGIVLDPARDIVFIAAIIGSMAWKDPSIFTLLSLVGTVSLEIYTEAWFLRSSDRTAINKIGMAKSVFHGSIGAIFLYKTEVGYNGWQYISMVMLLVSLVSLFFYHRYPLKKAAA